MAKVFANEPSSDGQDRPSTELSIAQRIDTSEDRDVWRLQNRCGVNSVYLFARLLGRAVRYDDALNAIPIGERGTSMADMKAYLQHQGVNVEVIKTAPAFLKSGHLPVIALLEDGMKAADHFCVVLGVTASAVWIIDGTTGSIGELPLDEFNEQWRGFLLVERRGQTWLRWTSLLAILAGSITVSHAFAYFRCKRKIAASTP